MEFTEKLLDFYKELYYFELDRKDKINSYLSFPLAILVLIIGVVSYFLNNLPSFNINSILSNLFHLFLICLSVNILCSLYYFIKSIYGYGYGYIATATEIDSYIKKLEEYNKEAPTKQRENIETAFEELLLKQYSEYSSINSKNNDTKSRCLHNTSKSLVIALIFIILSSVPFFILKYNLFKEKKEIKITTSKGGSIMSEENKKKTTPKPEKPKPPKGQIIKEAELKKAKKVIIENKK